MKSIITYSLILINSLIEPAMAEISRWQKLNHDLSAEMVAKTTLEFERLQTVPKQPNDVALDIRDFSDGEAIHIPTTMLVASATSSFTNSPPLGSSLNISEQNIKKKWADGNLVESAPYRCKEIKRRYVQTLRGLRQLKNIVDRMLHFEKVGSENCMEIYRKRALKHIANLAEVFPDHFDEKRWELEFKWDLQSWQHLSQPESAEIQSFDFQSVAYIRNNTVNVEDFSESGLGNMSYDADRGMLITRLNVSLTQLCLQPTDVFINLKVNTVDQEANRKSDNFLLLGKWR